ncbi:MAG: DUF2062 domain-containing protein [Steroidobacterales bacterium]
MLRRIRDGLLALLKQGVAPDKLALCVAIGIVIGNIPFFGTSTILCMLIALVFRLNLPAMQLVQAVMAPTQLLLIIPFVRLGEWLLRVPPQPLSMLWAAILHAGFAFLLVAPIATFALYRMLRPAFRYAAARK